MTTNTTTSKIEFVGVTDERDTCDKCGKTHLKRVVVLKIDGEFAFYGTDCAAKALRMSYGKNALSKSSLDDMYNLGMIVKKWFAKGFTAQVNADAVSRRYGYATEVKGGVVIIHTSNGKLEIKGA